MDELVNLIAKKFIATTDYKCFQDGDDFQEIPGSWTREDLKGHLAGEQFWWHLPVNAEGKCKFFCLQASLAKTGKYPWPWNPEDWDDSGFPGELRSFSPQESWNDRSHESRNWLKLQMKTLAAQMCHVIRRELEIPCAVMYGGDGGLYIYGFTGLIEEWSAQAAGKLVMDMLGWKKVDDEYLPVGDEKDLFQKLSCLTAQVWPSASWLPLPLGTDPSRPGEPIFFLDMSTALTDFGPVDPVWALTTDNCFKGKGE